MPTTSSPLATSLAVLAALLDGWATQPEIAERARGAGRLIQHTLHPHRHPHQETAAMTTMTTKLTGTAAIAAAEAFGLTLHKYADPTEGERGGITVAEAREIAAQDPRLVWVDAADLAAAVSDRQIRALKSEAMAAYDYAQADLCDRALATDTIDQDGNEIALAGMSREDARIECAKAIADAQAEARS